METHKTCQHKTCQNAFKVAVHVNNFTGVVTSTFRYIYLDGKRGCNRNALLYRLCPLRPCQMP